MYDGCAQSIRENHGIDVKSDTMECYHFIASKEKTTTLREQLSVIEGFEDMIIEEGMYTFSRQSLGLHKFLQYDSNKLYFREVGGLLYIMWFLKESDWSPNTSLQAGEQWPTTLAEPLKPWLTPEFNVHGRCPRTVLNILQHSIPPTWMVAIVGLTHMLPVFVNDGVSHKIIVFEGDAEIRSKVLDWVQMRKTTEVYKRNVKRTMEVCSSSNNALGSVESENATAIVDAGCPILV